MRPVRYARVSQAFANPGSYASSSDSHGPAGHHTGIDFGKMLIPVLFEIEGQFVRSATPGTVVIAEYNSTMGNWVGVYYAADDVTITYWHMERRMKHVGDTVERGSILGVVGSTGNSTAPHLHVQANRGREFDYSGHIDPSPWCTGYQWWRDLKRKTKRRRTRR